MPEKQPLPDSDHIARYCGGSFIESNGRPNGSAFRLKEKDGKPEEHLSVDWLEYLSTDRQEALEALRDIFRRKMRKVGKTAKFAVLNVGQMIEYVAREASADAKRLLTVLHLPWEDDPAHSGVFGFTIADSIVADLIAEVVLDVQNAS